MAITGITLPSMYEGLKYNFLFNNDINCIHILLNLYDIEDNITNIFPKYLSINLLRKQIERHLKNRKGKYLIARNLGQLIHEDINRLELYIYLEGYKNGYLNKKGVDNLEAATIKHYCIEELYDMKYLFHFENPPEDISELKSEILREVHLEERDNRFLFTTIEEYCDMIIKNKVFSLNKFVDKQLTIEYDTNAFNIKEDEILITLEDLNSIYEEIIKIIFKNGLKLYKDAHWNGLNDRVLRRYR